MNTIQIVNKCKDIYRYLYPSRERKQEDANILSVIIYMYNHTDIDYEEVIWLWKKYLETGVLDFPTAISMARKRIDMEYYEDIKSTEEELIHWLTRGV